MDDARFTHARAPLGKRGAACGGYVQDMRLPGMVHARVVRLPSYSARLRSVDTSRVKKMPGVLKIVRNGSYLAVIAEGEYQVVVAMRGLMRAAIWEEQATLPAQSDIYSYIQRLPAEDRIDLDNAIQPSAGLATIEATYHRPYQMHGSIGPSCAVGLYDKKMLTVWS